MAEQPEQMFRCACVCVCVPWCVRETPARKDFPKAPKIFSKIFRFGIFKKISKLNLKKKIKI